MTRPASRWTHTDRTARNRKGRFHRVDPHYNGNGLPAFWTCYVCGGKVRLDGGPVPITVPIVKVGATAEPPMSAQP